MKLPASGPCCIGWALVDWHSSCLSADIESVAKASWFGHDPGDGNPSPCRADSKFQQGSDSGSRRAIASSAVMTCITACNPARID